MGLKAEKKDSKSYRHKTTFWPERCLFDPQRAGFSMKDLNPEYSRISGGGTIFDEHPV